MVQDEVRTPENPEQAEQGTQEGQEQPAQEKGESLADLMGFSPETDSDEQSEPTESQEEEQTEPADEGQQEQDSEAEAEESDQAAEQQDGENSEEKQQYTQEELEQVVEEEGWDGIDPERLSEQDKKTYKLMQKAFTKKSQRWSEELKTLAQKKADIEGFTKGVTLTSQEDDQAYTHAVNAVKGQFGDRFDEYDNRVQAAINERYARNVNDIRYKKGVANKVQTDMQQMKAQEPYFQQIDNLANQMLQTEYNASDRDRVLKALNYGNTEPAKRVFEEAKKRFYTHLKQQQAQQQGTQQQNFMSQAPQQNQPQAQNQQPKQKPTKPKPPVTESGGQGKSGRQQKADDLLEIMGFE